MFYTQRKMSDDTHQVRDKKYTETLGQSCFDTPDIGHSSGSEEETTKSELQEIRPSCTGEQYRPSVLLLKTQEYSVLGHRGDYTLKFLLGLVEGDSLELCKETSSIICNASGIYRVELIGKIKSKCQVVFAIVGDNMRDEAHNFNTIVVGNRYIRGAVLVLPLEAGNKVRAILVPDEPLRISVYPQTTLVMTRLA
jgi:hypothetical protein